MAAGSFNVQQIIQRSRSKTVGSASTMRFPNDIGNHYMLFRIKDYIRIPNINPALMKKTIASFALPVPLNLVESFSVSASPAAMYLGYNVAQDLGTGATSSSLIAGLNNDAKAIAGTAESAYGHLGEIGAVVLQQMITGGKADFLKPIKSTVEAATGLTLNPNYTLLFQGVPLREYTYNWVLVPESLEESAQLGEIIKTIKTNILPAATAQSMVLNFPSIFELAVAGTGDPNWQIQYKAAFCKDIVVNRAPRGVASFSRGTGAPSAITLSMKFQELESFVAEDIDPNVNMQRGLLAHTPSLPNWLVNVPLVQNPLTDLGPSGGLP